MLNKLTTESRNPASEDLDQLSALEIVQLMNAEDARVSEAVRKEAVAIGQAIDLIAGRLQQGGRLIYLGAGTSGRLGVLDASECPPTFNTSPELVIGLIAGGPAALTRSIEGAEDHPEDAVADLQRVGLTKDDALVGIATSGRTPYVIGGLRYAGQVGAATIGFCCNGESELGRLCEVLIAPVVGPEVVSGSTRLKAGTATKMVLNMLTTGVMVLLGKTYGNLMVDLRASNHKLIDRTRRIAATLLDISEEAAEATLRSCDGELKVAVVAHQLGLSPETARERLAACGGHLRQALGDRD